MNTLGTFIFSLICLIGGFFLGKWEQKSYDLKLWRSEVERLSPKVDLCYKDLKAILDKIEKMEIKQ